MILVDDHRIAWFSLYNILTMIDKPISEKSPHINDDGDDDDTLFLPDIIFRYIQTSP